MIAKNSIEDDSQIKRKQFLHIKDILLKNSKKTSPADSKERKKIKIMLEITFLPKILVIGKQGKKFGDLYHSQIMNPS